MTETIRFDNGATYERYMGRWSQLVGHAFIDWLAPPTGRRWLDVGCGNGAFTELIATRCAPAHLAGIDPSAGMLGFARERPALRDADLRQGDAMELPFADDSADIAVMPLVIFFVPDPARALAEMARVVAPGGVVCAYSWDMDGGGFPYALLQRELESDGTRVPPPPNPDVSRQDISRALWLGAGLRDVVTDAITVQRTFENFEDYWSTLLGGPRVGATLAALSAPESQGLRERLTRLLRPDAQGRIRYSARANTIRGTVAGR